MAHSYVKPNCLDCQQMKDLPQEDVDFFGDNDLILESGCHHCNPTVTLEQARFLKERRLGLGMICKDCHCRFVISPDELVWLLENDLIPFKRCPDCRKVNKAKKEVLDKDEAAITRANEVPVFVNHNPELIISDEDLEELIAEADVEVVTDNDGE